MAMNDGNDPSVYLKNKGQVITIEDARGNEKEIKFKAMLTAFEDKYESNWNETEVYARMDPIYTYQNTKRIISIGFDVPAYSLAEAKNNLQRMSTFTRLLYPTYAVVEGVAVLSDAPIFKVKFGNLIADANNGGPLYGVIKSQSFKPKLEAGVFTPPEEDRQPMMYPKALEVSFDFNVLHAHALGYEKTGGKFRGNGAKFPYQAGGISPIKGAARSFAGIAPPGGGEGPAEVSAAQASSMLDPTQGGR